MYDTHLSEIFPWHAIVAGDLAFEIARFLAQPGEDSPDGSSFAVIATARFPGSRVVWLSSESHTRLAAVAELPGCFWAAVEWQRSKPVSQTGKSVKPVKRK